MSSLKLEVEKDRPYLNPDVKNKIYVSMKVKASGELAPLYSVILLDNSGSMASGALQYAKEAIKKLVGEMDDEDAISVLSFNKDVTLVFPPSKVIHKASILKSIEGISAESVTKMHGAITYLKNLLQTGKDPNRETRVILLSDGEPTDVKEPAQYSELVSSMRRMGITFSTVGIGASDDRVLRAITDSGGGTWTNVWNLEDLGDAFVKDMNRAKLGRTQKLYLYPRKGVSILEFNLSKPRAQKLDVIPVKNEGIFYSILPTLGEDLTLSMQLEISSGIYSEGENKIIDLGLPSGEGEVDWQSMNVDFTHDEELLKMGNKGVGIEGIETHIVIKGKRAIDNGDREGAEEAAEDLEDFIEEHKNDKDVDLGATRAVNNGLDTIIADGKLDPEESKKLNEETRGGT